jgi:hypothetical protein
MKRKALSISEFKAHCTEEIRSVEKGGTILELTRHGKKVAIVQAHVADTEPALANWIGSGKGTVTFAAGYDPAASAWDSSDWES